MSAVTVEVSTHACSLMSRRRNLRRIATRMSSFNPRLLVDEQATSPCEPPAGATRVSTHACSLMSRRLRAARPAVRRRCFNPRLLVDEQATTDAWYSS